MSDSCSEKMSKAVQETLDDDNGRNEAIGKLCDQAGFSETAKTAALRLANTYANILSN